MNVLMSLCISLLLSVIGGMNADESNGDVLHEQVLEEESANSVYNSSESQREVELKAESMLRGAAAKTCRVQYYANGGVIKDSPHYWDTRGYYFKLNNNCVYYSTSKNGTYNVRLKNVSSTETILDLHNVTTFGLTKTGYHQELKKAWRINNATSGTIVSAEEGIKGNECKKITNLCTTENPLVKLYVNWQPNEGTWIYKAHGGTIKNEVATYKVGSTTWYVKLVDGTVCRAKSKTGNFTEYESSLAYNSSATKLNLMDVSQFGITKTGYHPKSGAEWNTKMDGTGISFSQSGNSLTNMRNALSLNTTNGKNVKLYVQWEQNKYSIAFKGNGSTTGSTASVSAKYGESVKLTTNGFSRDGYTFIGWNTKANGTGTSYSNKASVKNLTATNNGTVNLYAQWSANKYVVTYDYAANGGDSATVASKSVATDAAVDLKPKATKNGDTGVYSETNKCGWEFIGWNTSKNATTALSSLKMPAKNITLYAIYAKTVTATYVDYSEGARKERTVSKTVYNTNTVADMKITSYNKVSGWSFVGWCIGTGVDAGILSDFGFTKDVILYAKYKKGVQVTFVNSNDTKTMSKVLYFNSYDRSAVIGGDVTAPHIMNQDTWSPIGWSREESATESVELKPAEKRFFQDSVTFYAVYKKPVTLSYNANGGTITPDSVSGYAYLSTSGDTQAFSTSVSDAVSKPNYVFKGWNTLEDGTGIDYEPNSDIELLDDLILYARYTTGDEPDEPVDINIKINTQSIVLQIGEKYKLSANVTPEPSEPATLKWSSNDLDIAGVNFNGELTAKSVGITYATVCLADNPEVCARCKVTVIGCTVKVPPQMTINMPIELSVEVNNNAKKQKKAYLKLLSVSNLEGLERGASYKLKACISKDGINFKDVQEGENLIVTSDSGIAKFKVIPEVSSGSITPDMYTADVAFELTLQ